MFKILTQILPMSICISLPQRYKASGLQPSQKIPAFQFYSFPKIYFFKGFLSKLVNDSLVNVHVAAFWYCSKPIFIR